MNVTYRIDCDIRERRIFEYPESCNEFNEIEDIDYPEVGTDLGIVNQPDVLILGLSYRGGVKEATLSSALLVAAALRSRGAGVRVHDPLFSPEEIAALGLESGVLPTVGPIDAVIVQAAHPEYRELDLACLDGCRVFLDGRGAFDRERVEAAGLRYIAIGLGR